MSKANNPDIEFTDEGPVFVATGELVGKVRMVEKSGIRPVKQPEWTDDEGVSHTPEPIWNDTGIEPVEFKCVVRLDPIEEVTSGGIIKVHVDREQMAHTQATLLAVGGNAFEDWNGRTPKPGDRIMITKYSGITREADPTDLIRVIHDKEILAVLT